MSDSLHKEVLNVSAILAGYPTEEILFRSTQKFVVFLGDLRNFYEHLYDYLVDNADSEITPYRMLVPSKLNGKNVTFVFRNYPNRLETDVDDLADAIYFTRVIFKKSVEVKILCHNEQFSVINKLKNICNHCLGIIECRKNSPLNCFPNFILNDVSSAEYPKMRNRFFYLLHQNLKFETIDSKTLKLAVWPETERTIIGFFNDFNRKISDFARKVCDHLAPNHKYVETGITEQNQTYVRFQATNLFRFSKKEGNHSDLNHYVPYNLEKVFEHLNSSIAEIYNEWQDYIKKSRHLIELKPYFNENAVSDLIEGCRANFEKIKIVGNINFNLNIDERTQQLREIHDRLEFQQNWVVNESDIFMQVVADKFEDISTNLIRSIVTVHVDSFQQTLYKLETWVAENSRKLEKDAKISKFFGNLNKKVDKYFSFTNAYLINSWFLSHRRIVPHDWHSRLFGFGRPEQYWLMSEYEISHLEKTIFEENLSFSEFVNIIDFYLRESFESIIETFQSCNQDKGYCDDTRDYENIDFCTHSQNFNDFFENWKIFSHNQSKVPVSFLTLLQTKYQRSFGKISFETVRQTFQNSAKRPITFTKDILDFATNKQEHHYRFDLSRLHFNHTSMQNIHGQFQAHGRFLFDEFKQTTMDRVIKNMIEFENWRHYSVVGQLGVVLIDKLKSMALFDPLIESQPYRKIVDLKYSFTTYENFVREIVVIFDTIAVSIPDREHNYLKVLQSKFNRLHNQTEFKYKINTHRNWGRDIIILNSGKALRSPINVGVTYVKLAIHEASSYYLDSSFFILLFSGLIILLKFLKLK
jgi:hypothetical protein